MKKTKIFFLLFILSFVLSGCYLPVLNKEVTMPFLEKEPELAMKMMIDKMSALPSYKINSNILFGVKFATSSENTSSSLLGNNGNIQITVVHDGMIDKTDADNPKMQTNSQLDIDLNNTVFKFAQEIRLIDKNIYFKLSKIPDIVSQMIRGTIGPDLDPTKDWWEFDTQKYEEMIKNFVPANSDGTGIVDPMSNKENADKLAKEVNKIFKESDLIKIDERLKDEPIDGQKCYHYKVSLKKENIPAVMQKVFDAYSEIITSSTTKTFLDTKKKELNVFINGIGDIITQASAEVWVDKDEFYLRKITFDFAADLSNFKIDNKSVYPASFILSAKGEEKFSNFNEKFDINKPEPAKSLTDLIEKQMNAAREKSRDAKRVSDVKQMQTALELYFNDASRYPESVDFKGTIKYGETTYLGYMPETPKPNDGTCPADFEYKYEVKNGGQRYELTYCLGAQTGMIPAGINVASPEGISQDLMQGSALLFDDSMHQDSDNDGLFDYEETEIYKTNPQIKDTDGDSYDDGKEVNGWYDPLGKGKIEDPFATPEGTLRKADQELFKGNSKLYIDRTYYSAELTTLIKDDFGMTKDQFNNAFVKLMAAHFPDTLDSVYNITKKTTTDENNVVIEYRETLKTSQGALAGIDDDKTYLTKIGGKWMNDLGKEFGEIKVNDPIGYNAIVNEYKKYK